MGFSKFIEYYRNTSYSKALEIFSEVENSKINEASIYKSRILVLTGKHKAALITINKTLDRLDETQDTKLFVIGRIVKSTVLLRTHDNKVGLEFALDTKRIHDKLEFEEKQQVRKWIGMLVRTIGVYYDYGGQLELALEYYEESLELESLADNIDFMGHSHNNIGEIYRTKGQLDIALQHYKKSIKLISDNDLSSLAVLKANISIIYYMQGKIDEAIELALEVRETATSNIVQIDPILQADNRYYLIVYYISISKYDEANIMLHELSAISKENKSNFIIEYEQLSKAYLLKSSDRMKDKTRALMIFEELLDDRTNIRNHEIITTSLLSLCEILIYELKLSNSADVMSEIQNYLEDLVHISRKNQSYALIVNTLGLQAKLAIIQGEFDKAETLFQQAILTSDEFSLTNHLVLWENEHREFIAELDKWKLLTEASATISERLTVSKFEKYLDSALKMAMGSK